MRNDIEVYTRGVRRVQGTHNGADFQVLPDGQLQFTSSLHPGDVIHVETWENGNRISMLEAQVVVTIPKDTPFEVFKKDARWKPLRTW